MGFKNEYRYNPGKYGYGLAGETILPFFGFTYDTEKIKSWKKEGGEITLSQNSFGDYKVGQNPTYYRDTSYEVIIFRRKNQPMGREIALENRFIELARKSGKYKRINADGLSAEEFDERRLPGIPNSVTEYYCRRVLPSNSGVFKYVFPILAFIVFAIIFKPIEGSESFARDMVFTIGLTTIFFFIGWLIDHIREKQIKDYGTMTEEEKNKIKVMYFNYMKQVYGEEIGEVLKEYAILKGYDCI